MQWVRLKSAQATPAGGMGVESGGVTVVVSFCELGRGALDAQARVEQTEIAAAMKRFLSNMWLLVGPSSTGVASGRSPAGND
jgi:hypothetical protein